MNLGSLLIPILGGYWFLTHLYLTRFGALRDSGYHLFFRSAFTGLALAFVAHIIILGLEHYFPRIEDLWKLHVPSSYYGTAILSIALGFLLPFAINPFCSREKAAQRVARNSGDLIELMIAESLEREMLVELSLKSGKSYIGFALKSEMAQRSESDIALIPIASGYRNKDTQELEITTNYAPVIQECLEDGSKASDLINEDFRVVIPRSEIVSARLFLPEAYQRFQET